ncbi:MAG: signal peptidase I [Candidatus Aminicenantes bacterium]|nr:signal peptidase I [Candidatus Aminicenantes bacterium]
MAESRFRHFVKYVVIDILLAALISFFLINYVVSAFKIEGDSMKPILRAQERILISKLAVRKNNLHRFDIVVLYKPDEPEKSLVKRIIGMPGEIIEIRAGDVWINDKPLKQLPGSDPNAAKSPVDMKALLIPRGMFFVMGDNRSISFDSRMFGPVPQKYIFGKAFFRYWPVAVMGRIE